MSDFPKNPLIGQAHNSYVFDGFGWSYVPGFDHSEITSIGTNTHVQIDTHLAESAIVSGDNPHGFPLNKYDATGAPSASDDGAGTAANGIFAVGSNWADVTNDKSYMCLDSTTATAVWLEVAATGSGSVTGGDAHTHNGSPTAKINHSDLNLPGTNAHSVIDSHIADGTLHYTQANIVATGAVNAGSITSGFTSINIGTGTLNCGLLTSAGIDDNATGLRLVLSDTSLSVGNAGVATSFQTLRGRADSSHLISGGTTSVLGGVIELFGETNAKPSGMVFRDDAATTLEYTTAAGWNFQTNALTSSGGGSLTGTWTNLGSVTTIDINGGTIDGITGDVTGAIPAAGVTVAKIENIATDSFLGRDTAAAGPVEVLSAITARAVLNVEDGSNAYVHPNHSGHVFSVADGATTIQPSVVTLPMMVNQTAGQMISYAVTTNAPVIVAAGTTGQLLTAVTGGAPTFQTILAADPNFVGEDGTATPSATGVDSIAIGPSSAAANVGQFATASGQFAAAGDAQHTKFVCRASTTDATTTYANPDGGGTVVGNNRMILPANTMWGFTMQIAVRENAGGFDNKYWEISGAINRDGAGVTAMIGSVTKTVIAADAGASAWDVVVTADNVTEALQIAVTGEAATTLRWVAVVSITEVSG